MSDVPVPADLLDLLLEGFGNEDVDYENFAVVNQFRARLDQGTPVNQNELLAAVLYKLLIDESSWVSAEKNSLILDGGTNLTPEEYEAIKRVVDGR